MTLTACSGHLLLDIKYHSKNIKFKLFSWCFCFALYKGVLNHSKRSFCLTGSKNTVGEFFNPGYDCSNILNKRPDAQDGFYWITLNSHNPQMVCVFNICSQTWVRSRHVLIAESNYLKFIQTLSDIIKSLIIGQLKKCFSTLQNPFHFFTNHLCTVHLLFAHVLIANTNGLATKFNCF